MKRILIIISLLLPLFNARAQYVTYNHDETKMYQVTVMETGVGNLTPRAFYSVVHNKYYQTANEIQARQNGLVEDAATSQAPASQTPPQTPDSLQMPSLNLPQK